MPVPVLVGLEVRLPSLSIWIESASGHCCQQANGLTCTVVNVLQMVQFLGSLSRICGQFLFLCQEASTLPEALIGVSLFNWLPNGEAGWFGRSNRSLTIDLFVGHSNWKRFVATARTVDRLPAGLLWTFFNGQLWWCSTHISLLLLDEQTTTTPSYYAHTIRRNRPLSLVRYNSRTGCNNIRQHLRMGILFTSCGSLRWE